MTNFRTRTTTVLIAAACFTTAAGATVAVASSESNSQRSLGPAAYAHHRVSPALLRHFALLRRTGIHQGRSVQGRATSVAPASMPPAVQNMLDNMTSNNQELLLNVAETQQVSVGPSATAWVVPGSAGACIMTTTTVAPQLASHGAHALVATCNSTSRILAHGLLAQVDQPDGTTKLYGLVPDGNATVTVTDPAGATATAPTVSNVLLRTSQGLQSISFRDGSGATVTEPLKR